MTPEALVQPKTAAPAGADAVTPINPAPEAAPTAQAAPGEVGQGPPVDDAIFKIPAFAGLFAGHPSAFSANGEAMAKTTEGKLIAKNADGLKQMGIGLYRSLGGDLGVLFNQMFITGEELKAADAAGTLTELAPDFDQVNAQISGLGPEEHPASKKQERPTGFRTAPAPTPPQSQSPVRAPAPPTKAEAKLQNRRMTQMQPGAPTSGANPGAGRLLNQILKPVL
jgi:hypothetical protein